MNCTFRGQSRTKTCPLLEQNSVFSKASVISWWTKTAAQSMTFYNAFDKRDYNNP